MMDTKMGCIVDIEHPTEEVIDEAAGILRRGGLVAFPTETVYGLGGNGLDDGAARKIYEAKGRPSDNPLILHIADSKDLDFLAAGITADGRKLIAAFWPGPLTLIFWKAKAVPDGTTGGLDTVAVRMPSHPVAKALIGKAGMPIAAPSANASGRPSPTTARHVAEDLQGRIDYIIDGGRVGLGLESTIVDVTGDKPVVLRPGYITLEMLREVVPDTSLDPGLEDGFKDEIRPKAPGMKYKHYAPKGDMTLYEGDLENVVLHIRKKAVRLEEEGRKVGVIATDETKDRYPRGCVKSIGSRKDVSEIAYNLYAILREFDDLGMEVILSESIPGDSLGQAVMNRLNKAAGYQIEKV